MTYTLTMATEGIRIADDGVAEVSMTDARALLTRLIRSVRERGPAGAFTERGERTAYVVTPAFYDQAQADRHGVQALARLIAEWPDKEQQVALINQFGRNLDLPPDP